MGRSNELSSEASPHEVGVEALTAECLLSGPRRSSADLRLLKTICSYKKNVGVREPATPRLA